MWTWQRSLSLLRNSGYLNSVLQCLTGSRVRSALSAFMCKASQDPSPEYNLYGTIVHAGCSPDSGHYYAYIKDALDRWYCCNDTYVSLATLEEVLSEKDAESCSKDENLKELRALNA